MWSQSFPEKQNKPICHSERSQLFGVKKLLQSMPTHSWAASWLMGMVPQKSPNRNTHPLCLQDVRQLFRKLVQTLLQDRHMRLDLSHFKYVFKNVILLFINYPWAITWKYDTHLHHLVPGALMSQLPQAVDEALTALAVDPTGLQHGLALLHQLHDAWHATQQLKSSRLLSPWIIKGNEVNQEPTHYSKWAHKLNVC